MRTPREPEWEGGGSLVRRFRAGLQLYLRCLWQMGRMRNVWLVLAVLAVGQCLVGRATAMRLFGATRGSGGEGVLVTWRVLRPLGIIPDPWREWGDPYLLGSTVLRGTSRPLNARLVGVVGLLTQAIDRAVGGPKHGALASWPSVLLAMVIVNPLYAGCTAALLGWILAGLRGERLTGRALLGGLRRGFALTTAWFMCLDVISLLLYSLLAERRESHLTSGLYSLLAVLIFPFLLLPAMAVRRGSSLASAAAALRAFRTHFPLLLGFVLAFCMTSVLVAGVVVPADFLAQLLWTSAFTGERLLGWPVAWVSQLLNYGLAVLVCTACMQIVLRAQPVEAKVG